MFADPAFFGYTDDGLESERYYGPCGDLNQASVIGVDRCYGSDAIMQSNQLRRISRWVNLLKHLEFNVTPDVILAYLVATSQGDILDSDAMFRGSIVNRDSCGDCKCADYGAWKGQRMDGFTVERPLGYYGCDPCGEWVRGDGQYAGNGQPKELVTMAKEYLRYRIGSFVNLIRDVSFQMPLIKSGDVIPNKIINAFNTITWDDLHGYNDEFIARLEALHAEIVPDVMTYGYRDSCSDRTPPSLKWDPTTTRKASEINVYGDEDYHSEFERATMITANQAGVLRRKIYTITDIILDSIEGNDDATTMKYCHALVVAMEIALMVESVRTGDIRGLNVLNLPAIDEANCLFLRRAVDSERVPKELKGWRSHVGNFAALRRLTPAGALVIGDLIECAVRNKGFYRSWDMIKYCDTFGSKKEYGCVASFLLSEYEYQYNVFNSVRYRIDEFRRKGGYIDEDKCRDC